MRRRHTLIVLTAAFCAVTAAEGGHESPIYPSYYPHEIELAAVAPDRAAELLLAGKIQAYVGAAPRFASPPPASIASVESLGAFVVVRVNQASPFAKDPACVVVNSVVRELVGKGGLIVHPYPVTPFHGDYLHHADLAEAAKAGVLDSRGGPGLANLKIRTVDPLARSLVTPDRQTQDADWDAEIATIDAAALVARAGYSMNGWLGPAWLRNGWFQASLFLTGADDADAKQRIQALLGRLQTADDADAVERINLERSLVSALAADCRTRVAGYTVKREYFSTVFTAGVENIAYDAVTGFNSPMFVRTVKLKDFPWNGWLALGIDGAPKAAWNPIAGFSDDFGRLMWFAVGDPASIPSPNEAAWMFNRVSDVQSSVKR